MKLLALDCSTETCSVALYENDSTAVAGDGRIVLEHCEPASRQHTQRLLPMVEQVLAASGNSLSQLDYIAFGRGPGSFTGLRIALGAVQGLAFGANRPVVPVSTLAGLAQSALGETAGRDSDERVLAAIDARMGEVYWACFASQNGLVTPLGDERLTAPGALVAQWARESEATIAAGSGWRCVEPVDVAGSLLRVDCFPGAGAIARLAERQARDGNSCAAEQALPVYLRDEVAWQKSAPVA